MSETVKIIVTLSKGQYENLKDIQFGGIYSRMIFNAVKNGIPLDDVKAEIREKSFNHYFEYGEYIGEDCRKERIIYTDVVLKILDNIGKAESEGE